MKKNSIVWRFFDRIEDRGRCTAVICKLCELEYRFFGNTTNMRVHLSRKHPIQWELAHSKMGVDSISPSTEGNHRYTKLYKQKIVDTDGNEIEIDNQTEDETATLNLVKEYERLDHSGEEWLEDPFENIESYNPKQKKIKIKKRIKQEFEDTPRKYSNYHLTSPLNFESSERAIVLGDQQPKDEYSVFGEYIANKLRKFKTPKTRGNIQQIITTVLWQAEYGAYDNVDSVKNLFFSNTRVNADAAELSTTAEQTTVSVDQDVSVADVIIEETV